ncbi:MAG: glycyl-radical enzyme activating protein [Chloroflexi bacterium]|nr:glycyl-radical enzyme activating protein [Chloroflexota bacterium]
MTTTVPVTGTIFNIQRFSIQDGPGIRTTVFVKGCPLRCLWCSNPESQRRPPELGHRDSLCTGCEKCTAACDKEAIGLSSGDAGFQIEVDRSRCDNCGKCTDVCAPRALRFYGQAISVDEAFDEVRRDLDFYINSAGGVTAGGGEPLSQARFVAELFSRCHELGIHTTLDTCGYASVAALDRVLAETDLVLYDLKLMDRQEHRRYTAQYNEVIIRNARVIATRRVRMIARIPMIPGVNGSDENLTALAKLVRSLGDGVAANLLPYHRFGIAKYKALDRAYRLTEVRSPSAEQLEKAVELFRRHGVDCAVEQ